MLGELDCDTLLLLFGLFIVIAGIHAAGVIDAAARLFHAVAGESPFRLFTLLVVVSVVLSAFIDNIPYVAAMLPVVQSIAALMNDGVGVEPYVFYFGLLTGATLGGNLTPIGASANIAAIGILRKHGEHVATRDFLRIGVPLRWPPCWQAMRISGWCGAHKRCRAKVEEANALCPTTQRVFVVYFNPICWAYSSSSSRFQEGGLTPSRSR